MRTYWLIGKSKPSNGSLNAQNEISQLNKQNQLNKGGSIKANYQATKSLMEIANATDGVKLITRGKSLKKSPCVRNDLNCTSLAAAKSNSSGNQVVDCRIILIEEKVSNSPASFSDSEESNETNGSTGSENLSAKLTSKLNNINATKSGLFCENSSTRRIFGSLKRIAHPIIRGNSVSSVSDC